MVYSSNLIQQCWKPLNELGLFNFTVHSYWTDDFPEFEQNTVMRTLNIFCLDESKVDNVFLETEKNRQMVSQILQRTFNSQACEQGNLPVGPRVKMIHLHF